VNVRGFRDGDAKAVALDGDFTSRDRMAGGEDPEFVGFLSVERDHRAPAHAQKLLHRHRAAAEHNGELDIDMVNLALSRHATTPFDSALVQPERVASV